MIFLKWTLRSLDCESRNESKDVKLYLRSTISLTSEDFLQKNGRGC